VVLAAFRVKYNSKTLPAPCWQWASTERPRFLVLHLGNLFGDWLQISINELVAAFRGKINSDTLPAQSWESVSTERESVLVLHLRELTFDWLQTSINRPVAGCGGKTIATHSLPYPETVQQWSMNDFWSCILVNLVGDWLQISTNEAYAAFRHKNNWETLHEPSWKWTSMERQWFLVSHLGWFKCHLVAMIHIRCNGCLFNRNSTWHISYPIMTMSINAVSTIFGSGYWVITALRWYLSS